MFKDQTPILLTRQIHDAKRAGLHYDIRLVLGDKAYSWATRKDMPKLGETINIYEQPVHDSSYALRRYIHIPPGNYGAGTTTLDFVRKAVAHNKENFKGKFTLTVPSTGDRYLFRKVPGYGPNTWILKNLPPKPQIETTEKIEKIAMITNNKYLQKIASDLSKAEQYEKSEKKEVQMYTKEENEAKDSKLKQKLREIIPQEKEHAKKFESVVKEEEKRASINIKPSHKGLLHKKLGLSQDTPIPGSTLQSAAKGATGKLKKEIVFAENAKHWNHK